MRGHVLRAVGAQPVDSAQLMSDDKNPMKAQGFGTECAKTRRQTKLFESWGSWAFTIPFVSREPGVFGTGEFGPDRRGLALGACSRRLSFIPSHFVLGGFGPQTP